MCFTKNLNQHGTLINDVLNLEVGCYPVPCFSAMLWHQAFQWDSEIRENHGDSWCIFILGRQRGGVVAFADNVSKYGRKAVLQAAGYGICQLKCFGHGVFPSFELPGKFMRRLCRREGERRIRPCQLSPKTISWCSLLFDLVGSCLSIQPFLCKSWRPKPKNDSNLEDDPIATFIGHVYEKPW